MQIIARPLQFLLSSVRIIRIFALKSYSRIDPPVSREELQDLTSESGRLTYITYIYIISLIVS